jgi:uncharacterized protein (DUF2141 family)
MKFHPMLSGTLILAASLTAQAAELTIRISDISESGGFVHWALFDSAEAFDNDGAPVLAARSRVQGATLTTTLHDLPEGRYAVRLFHDSNGNGELDRNMIGIPSEGYGFSNDAGARGPAAFDDAAVMLTGDRTIEVRVR